MATPGPLPDPFSLTTDPVLAKEGESWTAWDWGYYLARVASVIVSLFVWVIGWLTFVSLIDENGNDFIHAFVLLFLLVLDFAVKGILLIVSIWYGATMKANPDYHMTWHYAVVTFFVGAALFTAIAWVALFPSLVSSLNFAGQPFPTILWLLVALLAFAMETMVIAKTIGVGRWTDSWKRWWTPPVSTLSQISSRSSNGNYNQVNRQASVSNNLGSLFGRKQAQRNY